MPTYWKTVCAPKIIIRAGYLDKNQIKFWSEFIFKWNGPVFFEIKAAFY